jgi:Zn-dependent peptidase ImmA (M78 family)
MNDGERLDRGGFGPTVSNELVLRYQSSYEAFVAFKAQEWIEEFRVETNGRLDISATAEKVGVPVYYEMPIIDGERVLAQGMIRGLGRERGEMPIAIHLNPNWAPDEHNLTFGHELGHLFLEMEAGIVTGSGRDNDIENFCELFGRQMIVPLNELTDIGQVTTETITELMARFGVRHTTMFYQLMLAEKLPSRVFIDSSIGEVPNEFYSGKVRRHCLCLDCEMDKNHTDDTTDGYIPVYDLTNFEWSDITSNASRHNNISDMNMFALINKAYGRWSQSDDEKIRGEVERANALRRLLFETTTYDDDDRDDDIPF